MGLFSILEREGELQVNDKTRLSGHKSFNSKDVSEITTMTIKPESTGATIDCYSVSNSDRYLDWIYTNSSIDVGSQNNDLIFVENTADINATLTTGTYTLSQYATHVAAIMTSAGTKTYSASVSNNVITISASAQFKFKKSSAATQAFFELDVFNTSHTSDYVEYGNKIVTLAVGNGTQTDSKDFYIKLFSETGDNLYCSDYDLTAHEPDILNWVPQGRASFKNVYRRAQKLIIAWLDEKGYVNVYGDKYEKNDIVDIEEVRQWATFMSLRLIFQGISNSIDDVFDRKSKQYELYEEGSRQRAILRIDTDKDGVADTTEGLGIYSGSLFRK